MSRAAAARLERRSDGCEPCSDEGAADTAGADEAEHPGEWVAALEAAGDSEPQGEAHEKNQASECSNAKSRPPIPWAWTGERKPCSEHNVLRW